jgi:protein-disulfide isomerase
MASDFQCPACKYWHDSFSAEIERDYVETGKVRFAYINFPLSQHRNARDASEAAMCAAAQGKFWEMHDRIFASQEAWAVLPDPVGHFRSLATASRVDLDAWNTCLTDNVMLPMIDGDTQRGMTGGVKETPTFFVGSQVVGGAIPARDLRPLLDAAIARAGGGSR